MKEVRSEVEINAPSERVWHVLTDFGTFGEWNPVIPQISGNLAPGGELELHMNRPGMSPKRGVRHVEAVEPQQEMRWRMGSAMPVMFNGREVLSIEPAGENSVKFIYTQRFAGLLLPFMGKAMSAAERSAEEMAQALKKSAESI
ncbi:MAG: SRPBCC domain-containing protein [Dehalococcoidia bacterium]